MNERDGAHQLHEATKHGTAPPDPEVLVAYRRLDPGNSPKPFKEYLDSLLIPLPRGLVDSSLPATAVLSGEKGEASRLDSSLLATLLFLGAGVTRMVGPPGGRTYFRAAMSAGNLHPVEVYVVAGEMEGIQPGVYHFSPLQVALTPIRNGDHRSRLDTDAALIVVLTGIPWRTAWKYGERAWRHLYWDAGTMLANLLSVADAHGIENRTVLGFADDDVNTLLGIDGPRSASGPIRFVEYPRPRGCRRRVRIGSRGRMSRSHIAGLTRRCCEVPQATSINGSARVQRRPLFPITASHLDGRKSVCRGDDQLDALLPR